eukprot:m.181667 g.181667  ORF g.181667 m.181667 type:complete len:416 (-) comp32075_c3_seq1:238-1485(-)
MVQLVSWGRCVFTLVVVLQFLSHTAHMFVKAESELTSTISTTTSACDRESIDGSCDATSVTGGDDAGSKMRVAYGAIQGLKKQVSRVIYGTLFLHSVDDPFTLLDAVYATGCNTFDTAAIYADGKCESVMGQWLKQRPSLRENLVLITKGGCHGQDKMWSADISREHVRSGLIASLKRLGTTYVDVFLLHRDDEMVPVSDVVDMMHDLHNEGFFTVWGVSNWELSRLQAAIVYAKGTNKLAPSCDSLQMSLAQPQHPVWPDTKYMKPEARSWYTDNGVAVLAWEVLAKGFMTGKWDRADSHRAHEMQHTDKGRRRSSELSPTGETADAWREMKLVTAYCVEANFDRRDRADQMAKTKHMTMGQIAVQYIASQPFQSFVLVGTRNANHFADNARGGSSERLSADEIAWLENGDGAH